MTIYPLLAILLASWSGTLHFDSPQVDPNGYPTIPGTVNLQEPGVPVYPVKTLFIPVPPSVELSLSYSCAETDRSSPLVTAIPRAGILTGSGLSARTVAVPPVEYSVETVELEGIVPLAGSQVAVVNIYPFTEKGLNTSVSINLDWNRSGPGERIPPNHLLSLVAEGEVFWPSGIDRASSPFWGKSWARIAIEEGGAYEVSCSQLEDAGCSVTGSPLATVALFSGPGTQFAREPETEHSLSPVSVLVNDVNEDGIFNGDDTVRFLAGALNRFECFEGSLLWLYHRYATERVYWLTWGGEFGARMESDPGSPDSSPQWGTTVEHVIHLENGGYWLPRYELRTGWFWKKVNSGENTSVPLNLSNVVGSADITLVFAVPDFHIATSDGRKILPKRYSLKDAVFNMQRVALMMDAVK
ncbi:MAG: hypothetical protein GY852_04390, partial [bacterium]|nr:hypothetical protein [bacterium]